MITVSELEVKRYTLRRRVKRRGRGTPLDARAIGAGV